MSGRKNIIKSLKYLVLLVFTVLSFTDVFGILPKEIKLLDGLDNSLKWRMLFILLIVFLYLDLQNILTLNKLKHYLNIGISWQESDLILGMQSSADSKIIRVNLFQMQGFNNSNKPINNAQSYIISLKTYNKIPCVISVSVSGRNSYRAITDIPGDCQFNIQGPIGMELSDFISSYGEFLFVFDYDKKTYRKKYNKKTLQKQYGYIKPKEEKKTPLFF